MKKKYCKQIPVVSNNTTFYSKMFYIIVFYKLYGTEIFWIVFAVCYMLASLVISVYIYYMGRWKLNKGILLHTWIQIRQNICTCPRPMYKVC